MWLQQYYPVACVQSVRFCNYNPNKIRKVVDKIRHFGKQHLKQEALESYEVLCKEICTKQCIANSELPEIVRLRNLLSKPL